jgi:hypothetical protein
VTLSVALSGSLSGALSVALSVGQKSAGHMAITLTQRHNPMFFKAFIDQIPIDLNKLLGDRRPYVIELIA